MAEYLLNQKCLERNFIAPSQLQASLQFTGILIHPSKETPYSKNRVYSKKTASALCGKPTPIR